MPRAAPLPPETVGLGAALGRVIAEEVRAPSDVPAFDNSAMDGFAVRSADALAGARLLIVGESRAGAPARSALGVGEAFAISTGAAIPEGADAVVRVEDTRRAEGDLELLVAVERDRDVRHAGDDVRAGAVVLAPGQRLGPAELGVLASVGRATLLAGPRPRVAVVTTGDELVGVQDALPFGGVRNSGAYVMPALAERSGAVTVSVAHARDDPALVEHAIGAALDAADVVVDYGRHVGPGVTTTFTRAARRARRARAFRGRGAASGAGTNLVRHARRDAGLRAAGQPGVLARHVPAVRAAGAPGAGRRDPAAHAHDGHARWRRSARTRGACSRPLPARPARRRVARAEHRAPRSRTC